MPGIEEISFVDLDPSIRTSTIRTLRPALTPVVIGIISSPEGILTYDIPPSESQPSGREVILPEAEIARPYDDRAIAQALPKRFGFSDMLLDFEIDTEGIISLDSNQKITPRLYVPTHQRLESVKRIEQCTRPTTLAQASIKWRTPQDILLTLATADRLAKSHGAQRRSIVRAAIRNFMDTK